MTLYFKFPDRFVPEERGFQIYSAIKLFKGKYIDKKEAMEMCGLNEDNVKKFDDFYNLIEKKYIKLCGDGYADEDFLEGIHA